MSFEGNGRLGASVVDVECMGVFVALVEVEKESAVG